MTVQHDIEIDIRIDEPDWPAEEKLAILARKAVDICVATGEMHLPPHTELSLLFTNDAAIQKINKQWRNIDKPTNVLSFPDQSLNVGEMAGEILGDICFALETIDREASLEDLTFDHHLSHMIIHGFLHLFGYDHLTNQDAMIMENLETKLLAQLGVSDPYQNWQ